MPDSTTRLVFIGMLREEWRLHSRLFGGVRFALFPLIVFGLVTGAVWLLTYVETAIETILLGIHLLVFLFGLHTGSVGFIGRDALRNLLGDLTLLVFSARTLPISRRRLLGVFIMKDLLYYAGLFLLPVALGVAPIWLLEGGSIAEIAWLWMTLLGMFALGIVSTLTLIGLAGRGLPRALIAGAIIALIAAAWYLEIDPIGLTAYGAFIEPSAPAVLVPVGVIVVLGVIATVSFTVESHRVERRTQPRYRRWFGYIGDPIATKTLLDVDRSSGGFAKVLFSGAILFGVTAALVEFAGEVTGIEPSVELAYGMILGLTGFTTYNWLTQSDDIEGYLFHPLDVASVYRAKLRAFFIIGPVVALVFYTIGVLWQGGSLLSALTGAILTVGVTAYVFGVTIYLAGISPNEFLFDSLLFTLFAGAMMVALVPLLVIAFAVSPLGVEVLAAVGLGGVLLFALGLLAFNRAVDRWSQLHLG